MEESRRYEPDPNTYDLLFLRKSKKQKTRKHFLFTSFNSHYMEPRPGFEPGTSSLPWMRSTNWAIAALSLFYSVGGFLSIKSARACRALFEDLLSFVDNYIYLTWLNILDREQIKHRANLDWAGDFGAIGHVLIGLDLDTVGGFVARRGLEGVDIDL